MQTRKIRYTDPTGGGDDAILEIPIWVKPPDELTLRDEQSERYYFELGEEVEDND